MRLPFFLLFAITAVANPLHLNSRQTDTCSPCAAVSASVATQPSGPSATPTVAAQLAYDCLSSVPLNTSAALALVESIRPYLRWQSSTVYIKDPPEEYAEKVQEAVDVWGGLDGIVESLEKGEWESEFQVSESLWCGVLSGFCFVSLNSTQCVWVNPNKLTLSSSAGHSIVSSNPPTTRISAMSRM